MIRFGESLLLFDSVKVRPDLVKSIEEILTLSLVLFFTHKIPMVASTNHDL